MLAPQIRLVIAVLFSGLIGSGYARAADDKNIGMPHDPLIDMISTKAPEIIKYVEAKKFANIGVLKFLVQRPGEKLSDNVGELNRNMADYLEVALVQAAPPEPVNGRERVRIIKKASEKIARQQNALQYSHRSQKSDETRQLFFDLKYDLFWGKDKVEADAFITGEIVFTKNQKARIQFRIFDRNGKTEDLLPLIEMAPTLKMLTSAGYSLALAEKMLKQPDVESIVVGADYATTAVDDKQPDLLVKSSVLSLEADPFRSPIQVRLLYKGADGRTVEQPIVNGTVREPNENEAVSILIENPTKHTFAVLVKVNGLNTIFPEKVCLEPRLCHKWILKPGEKQLIEGFQSDDINFDHFKVLSPKQSKADEVNYGNDVGTIQIVSFKGEVVDKDPEVEIVKQQTEGDRKRIAITRGTLTFGEGPAPATLKELQGHLKDTGKLFSGSPRGLVVKGDKGGKKEIERFFFRSDVEAQNATIRYYAPQAR